MSDIVLAFEPPADGQGVGITNQDDSVLGSTINGVDFQSGVLLSLPPTSQIPATQFTPPFTCPSPSGAPGTQVGEIVGAGEFGTAAAIGRFNSAYQHVSVLVGTMTGATSAARLPLSPPTTSMAGWSVRPPQAALWPAAPACNSTLSRRAPRRTLSFS